MVHPLRVVIFDFGEVLCFRPTAEAIDRMAELFGVDSRTVLTVYSPSRDPYDRGDLSADEYWSKIASELGAKVSADQIMDLRRWDTEMWSNINSAMTDWHSDLRAAGWKTALLSNMPWDMAHHVQKSFTWLQDFDSRTFSCEVRSIKPDAAIFKHCVERLGVRPEEALFVDDKHENIQGAQKLGIKGIRFENAQQLRRELETIGFPVLPMV